MSDEEKSIKKWGKHILGVGKASIVATNEAGVSLACLRKNDRANVAGWGEVRKRGQEMRSEETIEWVKSRLREFQNSFT